MSPVSRTTSRQSLVIAAISVVIVAALVGCSTSATEPSSQTGPETNVQREQNTPERVDQESGDATVEKPAALKESEAPAGTKRPPVTGSSTATRSASGPTTDDGASGRTAYLVLKYWNDTVSRRPGDVEVVIEEASWKPRATRKADVGRIGPFTLNRTVQLDVYPDGRKKPKVSVSILVRPDMSGVEADAVHIALSDDAVRFVGSPVVGFDVSVPRR